MTDETATSRRAPPAGIIEVRVAELRQLFNEMDPAPFHEQDLDPAAVAFIVEWARELPRDVPLELRVHLDRSEGQPDEQVLLTAAIQKFFAGRSAAARRRFQQLMSRGRTSLAIGLAFLLVSLAASSYPGKWLPNASLAALLRESMLIGGWVAMWRPLEIFLYDWWPIRAEEKLLDRLARMPVQIGYSPGKAADAWRHDWPAMPSSRSWQESNRS